MSHACRHPTGESLGGFVLPIAGFFVSNRPHESYELDCKTNHCSSLDKRALFFSPMFSLLIFGSSK